jgi:Zn-dependent protease
LNPLRHIDPVGTILIPLITLFLGGILFGWAKPVPVNFNYLRNPKKDMLWVALAGPGANLAMALGWALVLKFANMMPDSSFSLPLALMGMAGINVNIVLMVLNLLPLLPLDGGRIAVSLLPNRLAYRYSQLEPYGMVLLVVLLFSGVLGTIMWPLINVTKSLILLLFGI